MLKINHLNTNKQMRYRDLDPYAGSVVALMHFDGSNGSNSFTDSSYYGHNATFANGDVRIDTAQSKFGGSSVKFDGTGDWFSLPGQANFSFGTGDFTIEFWVRFNVVTGTQLMYDQRAAAQNIFIYIASSKFNLNIASTTITGTTTVVTNTWYHVAITRSSGVAKMFIDGVQEGGDLVTSANLVAITDRPRLGAAGASNNATNPFNGWIDELRITKAVSRYNSNFTPPTAPFTLYQN